MDPDWLPAKERRHLSTRRNNNIPKGKEGDRVSQMVEHFKSKSTPTIYYYCGVVWYTFYGPEAGPYCVYISAHCNVNYCILQPLSHFSNLGGTMWFLKYQTRNNSLPKTNNSLPMNEPRFEPKLNQKPWITPNLIYKILGISDLNYIWTRTNIRKNKNIRK